MAAQELVQRAYALRRKGDRAASLAMYRQACEAFGNDNEGRAHCLRHIGDLALELGQTDSARVALREAEALYRHYLDDTLSLANTLRLLALLDNETPVWREARSLYERVAEDTGLDLKPALDECDKHLT